MADDRNLGFVGLGKMGGGLSRTLMRASYPLTVYDINQGAIDSLKAQGATRHSLRKKLPRKAM